MSVSDKTDAFYNPQRGGNLQVASAPLAMGWPQILPSTAAGWWDRRIKPFCGTYRGVWERYLASGLVHEIDPAIIDKANEKWHEGYDDENAGDITSETPWTREDSNGNKVEYGEVQNESITATPVEIANSYATGLILHYYYQLDLAKMVRRIASKLQKT